MIATMRSPERETEFTPLDNVLVTRLDVRDSGSITAAVATGLERFGRIDVLLNNAGCSIAATDLPIRRGHRAPPAHCRGTKRGICRRSRPAAPPSRSIMAPDARAVA